MKNGKYDKKENKRRNNKKGNKPRNDHKKSTKYIEVIPLSLPYKQYHNSPVRWAVLRIQSQPFLDDQSL